MSWVLILYIYAGALSDSDSVALTNIPGFKTLEQCQTAGEKTKYFTSGITFKNSKYVCIEDG